MPLKGDIRSPWLYKASSPRLSSPLLEGQLSGTIGAYRIIEGGNANDAISLRYLSIGEMKKGEPSDKLIGVSIRPSLPKFLRNIWQASAVWKRLQVALPLG